MNQPPDSLARTVWKDPVHILAFGFGTGLAPIAPGTFGSLPGVLLFWLTMDFGLYVQLGVALGIIIPTMMIAHNASVGLASHCSPEVGSI